MNNHDELKMTKSSGNVFKDLGYPNADEHLLKAKFAIVINNIIKEKNLTQTEAAAGLDDRMWILSWELCWMLLV